MGQHYKLLFFSIHFNKMGKIRQLSEEQLAKLAVAREKAMKIRMERAEKKREILKLEKEAQNKELDKKLEEVKKRVTPAPKIEEPASNDVTDAKVAKPQVKTQVKTPVKTQAKKKTPRKKAEDIIREVVEEPDSEDSDTDDDEDGDVINPVKHYLKEKYKAKYRTKYESKHLNKLVQTNAKDHLRKRLDDEIFRLASQQIFGA